MERRGEQRPRSRRLPPLLQQVSQATRDLDGITVQEAEGELLPRVDL